MPLPESEKPILTRCVWCEKKHVITPGYEHVDPSDDNPDYKFSDTLCPEAIKKMEGECDEYERGT